MLEHYTELNQNEKADLTHWSQMLSEFFQRKRNSIWQLFKAPYSSGKKLHWDIEKQKSYRINTFVPIQRLVCYVDVCSQFFKWWSEIPDRYILFGLFQENGRGK